MFDWLFPRSNPKPGLSALRDRPRPPVDAEAPPRVLELTLHPDEDGTEVVLDLDGDVMRLELRAPTCLHVACIDGELRVDRVPAGESSALRPHHAGTLVDGTGATHVLTAGEVVPIGLTGWCQLPLGDDHVLTVTFHGCPYEEPGMRITPWEERLEMAEPSGAPRPTALGRSLPPVDGDGLRHLGVDWPVEGPELQLLGGACRRDGDGSWLVLEGEPLSAPPASWMAATASEASALGIEVTLLSDALLLQAGYRLWITVEGARLQLSLFVPAEDLDAFDFMMEDAIRSLGLPESS